MAFSYNPAYVTKIKTIEGYRWNPREKYWSFSYSEGILEKILEAFDREDIHKKVRAFLLGFTFKLTHLTFQGLTDSSLALNLLPRGIFYNFLDR